MFFGRLSQQESGFSLITPVIKLGAPLGALEYGDEGARFGTRFSRCKLRSPMILTCHSRDSISEGLCLARSCANKPTDR
jgi:hypothetical protein